VKENRKYVSENIGCKYWLLGKNYEFNWLKNRIYFIQIINLIII